jgi:hypothetical protein
MGGRLTSPALPEVRPGPGCAGTPGFVCARDAEIWKTASKRTSIWMARERERGRMGTGILSEVAFAAEGIRRQDFQASSISGGTSIEISTGPEEETFLAKTDFL